GAPPSWGVLPGGPGRAPLRRAHGRGDARGTPRDAELESVTCTDAVGTDGERIEFAVGGSSTTWSARPCLLVIALSEGAGAGRPGKDQPRHSGLSGRRPIVVPTRHRRTRRLRRKRAPHIRDAGERDGPGSWGRPGALSCPAPSRPATTDPRQRRRSIPNTLRICATAWRVKRRSEGVEAKGSTSPGWSGCETRPCVAPGVTTNPAASMRRSSSRREVGWR